MTSATAPSWPDGAGLFTRLRLRFRVWRRTRPFWGGLLSAFAGFPILYFPYAHLQLGDLTMAMATTGGAGSLVIGLLMMALGVSSWFQPASRVFCGIAVTILALISIPVSNLGGFAMGLILGLIGGGLLCAWAPLKEPKAAVAAAVPEQATAEFTAEPAAVEQTVQLPEQSGATEQAGEAK
ncbi:DUF6114 domain-containing protein [Kitasatospora kifunensis]|uniref:Integral membrane protein n=1 Tax=Kitasatospora kifunensis TaxID=58351 RepID=A0A7W7VV46_KITKI|nr:DUF6114 domain-containing protein [Kitasatospora kifunensis]MBB4923503.1 hypothetical protein [Kitasatospora kifunensis]